jgi:hypothetical protein
MMIEIDVRNVAADFGIDAALIQAVVKAEGDIVKAVQCSIPSVTTREQALRVLCRSAVHAMSDWVRNDPARREEFVAFWGARWAPVGAANDPKGLNANWVPNVTDLWV